MAVMLSVDRQRRTLLGLAVGNALGAAVEFEMPGSFPKVTGYLPLLLPFMKPDTRYRSFVRPSGRILIERDTCDSHPNFHGLQRSDSAWLCFAARSSDRGPR